MAKAKLPSTDTAPKQDAPKALPKAMRSESVDAVMTEGYVSRRVDAANLTHAQGLALKRKTRELEDAGEKLADGTFVNCKTHTIKWLIENA